MLVYFVAAGEDGPIKIGRAKHPRKRLCELQVGCPEPLSLLGVMTGGEAEERAIHLELACYRVRGEWYERAFVMEYMREHGWPRGRIWNPGPRTRERAASDPSRLRSATMALLERLRG